MYDDRAFLYEVISMDWSDLRIFLAIAREGTLGAAARLGNDPLKPCL